MFRQIATLFLLTAFTAQVFNQVVIVLEYYVNTAAFAKTCENKSRPLMQCKGKCQMMKKLKEEEKKEQQVPERKADLKNEVVSSRSFFATLPFNVSVIPGSMPSYYFTSFPRGFHPDIFHPPGLV